MDAIFFFGIISFGVQALANARKQHKNMVAIFFIKANVAIFVAINKAICH